MRKIRWKRILICAIVGMLSIGVTGCQNSENIAIDDEELHNRGESETANQDYEDGSLDIARVEDSEVQQKDASDTMAEYDDVISGDTIERLANVEEIIEENFYFYEEKQIDQEEIVRSYVESLGDPYSQYYTAEEYAEYMNPTSDELGGIGVPVMFSYDEHTNEIEIMKVYGDAKEVGIKAQDILVEINGEDITLQDVNTVMTKLFGKEGTEITISIYRTSDGKEHEFTLKRQKFEIPTIEYRMLENNIGYIQVLAFRDGTEWEYINVIQNLINQGMDGLIVDLRDNGGGTVETAVAMLDYMLPEGIVGYQENADGSRKTFKSTGANQFDKPLVLLVNGKTASASEIFAGAIKDFETGTIVGETTYGKGIGQRMFLFADGSAMKLTTSQFLTPGGKTFHQVGIEPDVEVMLDTDAYRKSEGEQDNQLQVAIDEIKSMIGK